MAEDKDKKEGNGLSLNNPADGWGEEEEQTSGAPRWMATFADMVTLLMCFFVLLFAMSSTQQDSFKELVESLKSALGVANVPEAGTREGLIMPDSPLDEEKTGGVSDEQVESMVQKEVEEIVNDINELIMFNKLGGMVNVKQDEMGVTISVSDVVLFSPGQASMNEDGLNVMAKVAKVLVQFPYRIKISGHTDNIPIHTEKFASNWELSANRACDVVRFLLKQGMDPKKLIAEGYAEYRPVAPNTSAFGRSKNRRVEINYERREIGEKLEKRIQY